MQFGRFTDTSCPTRLLVALALTTAFSSCSSADSSSDATLVTAPASSAASAAAAETIPSTPAATDGPVVTDAPAVTDAPVVTDAPAATGGIAEHLRGQRYCEILLVKPVDGTLVGDVYTSFSLNDCPADAWAAIDPKAIAAEQAVPVALPNGPRYWLVDDIQKRGAQERTTATFGGIEMFKAATVNVGEVAGPPFTEHEVNRSTMFGFDAGQTVYELIDPTGTRYVMQSWSQQIEPSLIEADLDTLASRLQLPAGWSYEPRVLTERLEVITFDEPAHVLQDNLMNSYSRETTS